MSINNRDDHQENQDSRQNILALTFNLVKVEDTQPVNGSILNAHNRYANSNQDWHKNSNRSIVHT